MYTDITKVSQMAKQHKKTDPTVIDTTSGVFIDETFGIGYSKTFDALAKTLTPFPNTTTVVSVGEPSFKTIS